MAVSVRCQSARRSYRNHWPFGSWVFSDVRADRDRRVVLELGRVLLLPDVLRHDPEAVRGDRRPQHLLEARVRARRLHLERVLVDDLHVGLEDPRPVGAGRQLLRGHQHADREGDVLDGELDAVAPVDPRPDLDLEAREVRVQRLERLRRHRGELLALHRVHLPERREERLQPVVDLHARDVGVEEPRVRHPAVQLVHDQRLGARRALLGHLPLRPGRRRRAATAPPAGSPPPAAW